MVEIPSGWSGSGRETRAEVRKWSESIPEVWKWSGDLSVDPQVVGRPSRRSGNGRETIPEVQKWSETIPAVWNRSGDPP